MIENYPIKENDVFVKNFINDKNLFLYTLSFKNNVQSIKINNSLNECTFSVKYDYPDDLTIEIEWAFVNQNENNEIDFKYLYTRILETNQLFSLLEWLEEGKIKLKNARVISYSNTEKNQTNYVTSTRFFMIMKSSQLVKRMDLKLLGPQYIHNLEQNVKQKSKLPDDFFKEIVQKNNNIKLFEKYLEEHDAKE